MHTNESSYSKWRPHPWHGLDVGPNPPEIVNAFVEITPFDSVKYEIDKNTGYLTVDRPQLSSSLPPTNYGFIPRTYCSDGVANLSQKANLGDADPLDICVYSERPINRAEVILTARVVGAIKTIDSGKADDKIIGVLKNDPFWNTAKDIDDLPEALVQRLKHYFTTYKKLPDKKNKVFIERLAGAKEAYQIIEAAMEDYKENFL
jgi:inorganic pyrophosphatase